ncbi:MAG TPA: vanadium-dependent haloperoxidase, partial [Planctomycetia bacterium]|nr:vanadium-dependent haloperoxidase [Planctomycetia bacterium]
YTVLASRFPAQAAELAAKRTASLAAIEDGQSKIRGLAWGQAVAGAILTWRSTDGISPAPPPYLGGTAAGQWRPTGPAFLPGATPQFATMTPWLIQSPSQFLPPPPNALDSQAYADDLLEVRLMGSVGSPLRTADETDACRFWAAVSGTYAWNATAMDFAVANGYELSDNALLLARLNLAVADSIIGCWNAKYTYSYWRPDTAIEFDPFEPDAGWAPLIVTPNHPEYISGHSSVTGAALAVLIDAFGDDAPFAVESPVTPGWIRNFSSFSDAMSEVADARIFGGIHFRKACVEGANIGGNTVSFILANRMQRLHGEGE